MFNSNESSSTYEYTLNHWTWHMQNWKDCRPISNIQKSYCTVFAADHHIFSTQAKIHNR